MSRAVVSAALSAGLPSIRSVDGEDVLGLARGAIAANDPVIQMEQLSLIVRTTRDVFDLQHLLKAWDVIARARTTDPRMYGQAGLHVVRALCARGLHKQADAIAASMPVADASKVRAWILLWTITRDESYMLRAREAARQMVLNVARRLMIEAYRATGASEDADRVVDGFKSPPAPLGGYHAMELALAALVDWGDTDRAEWLLTRIASYSLRIAVLAGMAVLDPEHVRENFFRTLRLHSISTPVVIQPIADALVHVDGAMSFLPRVAEGLSGFHQRCMLYAHTAAEIGDEGGDLLTAARTQWDLAERQGVDTPSRRYARLALTRAYAVVGDDVKARIMAMQMDDHFPILRTQALLIASYAKEDRPVPTFLFQV